MVLDTSAIVAMLLGEPEAPQFRECVEADPVRLVSAATVVEAGIVVETRLGEAGGRDLDLLLAVAECEIVPLDAEQAVAARRAYRRYGKSRHPAGLNLGDCYSYALATISREPLLCKGDDFRRTDLRLVV